MSIENKLQQVDVNSPPKAIVFDSKTGKWKEPSLGFLNPENNKDSVAEKMKLRVVTYNVWFDSFEKKKRFNFLIDLIDKEQADVVGLQEVTPVIMSKLMTHQTIQKFFAISNCSVDPYGVIFLIRKGTTTISHVTFKFIPLTSEMNRKLLIAILSFEDSTTSLNTASTNVSQLKQFNQSKKEATLAIATVHLESLNNRRIRKIQLEECQKALEEYPSKILMGDFNFDATKNYIKTNKNLENDLLIEILTDYVDVWSSLRKKDDMGYTFDTKVNEMLSFDSRHNYEQMRYDRVMLSSKIWNAKTINILGNQKYGISKPNSNRPIFISDHFGLSVDISTDFHKNQ